MRALLVVAHPCADSFTHAAADAAETGLGRGGHTVDRVDLSADGFRAAMSREERLAYDTEHPVNDPQVADHVDRLLAADLLVFVYPTWWSGPPAILKGWLERVMVPGVAFTFDPRSGKVRPGLRHVRRIVGISTWGSPHRVALVMNDNGRRILTRALRMACGWRTRTTWLALYATDVASESDRRSFLDRITERMAGL